MENISSKQNQFMNIYEDSHASFVRYCKAKSYGIMDYEDLVRESILRAFENFNKIRKKSSFHAYLYGIANNIIKYELRKKQHSISENQFKLEYETISNNHALNKFEIEVLYKALAQLPETQKEAIILYEISGYQLKEIARIQNAGLSAVKQRIKRGREKLAAVLKNIEFNNEKSIKLSRILMSLSL